MTDDKFRKFVEHTLRDDNTEKYADLLVWFNANDIRTEDGFPYVGIRGVTSCITAAWRRAHALNDQALADRIRQRYVDRDGRYTPFRRRRS